MRKIVYLLLVTLLFFSCEKLKDYLPKPEPEPKPPVPQFNKLYGGSSIDWGWSINKTPDGGYIMAGRTDSNDGDVSGNHRIYQDAWVVKLDEQGNIEWQKALGGSGVDEIRSIITTPDGGYIMAGETRSNDGDVSGNHGSEDAWVVKLDKQGKIEWQKTLGGSGDDEALSITITADCSYVLAGFTYSNDGDVSGNRGDYDAWVVKLDKQGTIEWQKTLGGSDSDEAYSITTTADCSYVLAGFTYSNDGDVSGNHGDYDAWVVKLDKQGTIEWQKTLGGSNFDGVFSITTTTDGGYIMGGGTLSNDGDVSGQHGGGDAWVMKLDKRGNIEWQKVLGGSGNDEADAITTTADGGYIMAGLTASNDGDASGYHGGICDAWVVKLNKQGTIEWQKTLGGSGFDLTSSITLTSDGGYIMAGRAGSNDGDVSGSHGSEDAWVITLKDK